MRRIGGRLDPVGSANCTKIQVVALPGSHLDAHYATECPALLPSSAISLAATIVFT